MNKTSAQCSNIVTLCECHSLNEFQRIPKTEGTNTNTSITRRKKIMRLKHCRIKITISPNIASNGEKSNKISAASVRKTSEWAIYIILVE